jgi:hypothetical protein
MRESGKTSYEAGDGLCYTADRWLRARRALHAADRDYAEELAGMIRLHAGDDMAMIRDPLEAAVFAVLIEMMKKMESSSSEEPSQPGRGY